ncbi:TRAP transporter small permease [Bacillus sp. FJAT-45350]|uniref:TRAP transporter small permease n=1 Tax=Bacillus sp. FJAT-45350 TaxID=2011014 RepID=UPI000BB8213E|nr:TRAP transporter small permease [Bacillus sp. FJAT-45350]
MLTKVSKALDITENLLAAIGAILLLFVTFSVVFEIFSRYFFSHSFLWTKEITEYSLLYIPFLGAAWLLRTNGHITIDIIDMATNPQVQRIISIFVSLVGLFISCILVYFGTVTTLDLYKRGVTSISVLSIPQVYVYLIIPIGSFVLGLEFTRKLLIDIQKCRGNS